MVRSYHAKTHHHGGTMVGKTSNNARALSSTLDPHPPAHLSGVVAPNSRARRRQTRPLFHRTSVENSITRRSI